MCTLKSTCLKTGFYDYTVKPPIRNTPMAEHTADTEQFPWSQHAPLTYRRFQLRNNFLLGTKNLVPNPFLIWSFYCNNCSQRRSFQSISCTHSSHNDDRIVQYRLNQLVYPFQVACLLIFLSAVTCPGTTSIGCEAYVLLMCNTS